MRTNSTHDICKDTQIDHTSTKHSSTPIIDFDFLANTLIKLALNCTHYVSLSLIKCIKSTLNFRHRTIVVNYKKRFFFAMAKSDSFFE